MKSYKPGIQKAKSVRFLPHAIMCNWILHVNTPDTHSPSDLNYLIKEESCRAYAHEQVMRIFQKSRYRPNTNTELNPKGKRKLKLRRAGDYLLLLLGRAQSNPLRGVRGNYLQAARVPVSSA